MTAPDPDGQRYPNARRFEVLEPGRRWVVDPVSPPRLPLTITLAADGAGTRPGWSQGFETAAPCRALAPVCLPANEQNLDRLERVLAGGG